MILKWILASATNTPTTTTTTLQLMLLRNYTIFSLVHYHFVQAAKWLSSAVCINAIILSNGAITLDTLASAIFPYWTRVSDLA